MALQRESAQASIPSDTEHHIEKPAGISGLMLVCLVASLGGLLFGFDTAVIPARWTKLLSYTNSRV